MKNTITDTLRDKEAQLIASLGRYDSLAIAYSGGVDSTYLAALAHEALGEKAVLIMADSPSLPRNELKQALAIAVERGWQVTLIQTQEFEQEAFLKNDAHRCYVCKSEMFARMKAFSEEQHIAVLAHGDIAEDAQDPTRLGAIAAKEYQVIAPLAEAGLTKEEIRLLSKARDLPTWNKASFACLSSRFPTGVALSVDHVRQVEEAEQLLQQLGLGQYRARHHGDLCRIEVEPEDFPTLLDSKTREAVLRGMHKAGYRHVTLDLAGYRTGSSADKPE